MSGSLSRKELHPSVLPGMLPCIRLELVYLCTQAQLLHSGWADMVLAPLESWASSKEYLSWWLWPSREGMRQNWGLYDCYFYCLIFKFNLMTSVGTWLIIVSIFMFSGCNCFCYYILPITSVLRTTLHPPPCPMVLRSFLVWPQPSLSASAWWSQSSWQIKGNCPSLDWCF